MYTGKHTTFLKAGLARRTNNGKKRQGPGDRRPEHYDRLGVPFTGRFDKPFKWAEREV